MSSQMEYQTDTLRITVSVNGSKSPDVVVRHRDGGGVMVAESVPILDAVKREEWLGRLEKDHGGKAAREVGGVVLAIAADVATARMESEPAKAEQPQVEVWPDPVDGRELLEDIEAAIRRFLVMQHPEYFAAAALWAVFAHAHDAFRFSPILIATSPEKGSGKTRLLEVMFFLAPRAWLTTSPSDAVVFRKIDLVVPTFLLDEGDNVMWKERRELLSIFNAGYQRRSATVPRCVGEGASLDVKDFSTWCPKGLSCLKVPLPDTTVSRSIILHFKKKTRAEPVEQLRERIAVAVLTPLQRRAARWAKDHLETLRQAEPVAPDELSDRSADAWDPLLAIGDLVGGEWPARARSAALLLSGSGSNAESVGVLLLGDLRDLFRERDTDRLSSADIIKDFAEREDRPWSDWQTGRPINGRGVARLLKPFGIGPKTIRGGVGVFKGYMQEDFEDAWVRYLDDLSVDTVTSLTDRDLPANASVTPLAPVTDVRSSKSLFDSVVTLSTDKSGVLAEDARGDAWEEENA